MGIFNTFACVLIGSIWNFMGLKHKSFCVQILEINVAVTSCAKDSCSDGSGLLSGRSDAGQTHRGSSWGKSWGISSFCPASTSFECHCGGCALALGRASSSTGTGYQMLLLFLVVFQMWISCFRKCPVSQIAVCLQKDTLEILLVQIQIVNQSEIVCDFNVLDWNLPIISKMVLVTEEKNPKLM